MTRNSTNNYMRMEISRRYDFAYPLIRKYLNVTQEAKAMVKEMISVCKNAKVSRKRRVTNFKEAACRCAKIIIHQEFNDFDREFTQNIDQYVMNALDKIQRDLSTAGLRTKSRARSCLGLFVDVAMLAVAVGVLVYVIRK